MGHKSDGAGNLGQNYLSPLIVFPDKKEEYVLFRMERMKKRRPDPLRPA